MRKQVTILEESFFDNGENIEITNLNSVIRISNKQAQADYSVTKTKKKTSDGKTVYKKNTTTNDEKLADTCIEIFQNSNIEQKINLDNIKRDAYTYIEKAEDDLTPKTREYITLEELMKTWMAKLNDNCIFISAREKINMDELKTIIYNKVRELHVQKYPYNDFLYQTYDEE